MLSPEFLLSIVHWRRFAAYLKGTATFPFLLFPSHRLASSPFPSPPSSFLSLADGVNNTFCENKTNISILNYMDEAEQWKINTKIICSVLNPQFTYSTYSYTVKHAFVCTT